MAKKFDMSNAYPKILSDGEYVLDINQNDFRYFNQWMASRTTSSHIVQAHEALRLELISYKEYGTTDLWWIIGLVNGIVKFTEVQPGITLQIPSIPQIESYMQLIRAIKNGQSVAIK